MNTELAKQHITSYMRGDISREELEQYIEGFGDDGIEQVYTEYLQEQFNEFIKKNNGTDKHKQ